MGKAYFHNQTTSVLLAGLTFSQHHYREGAAKNHTDVFLPLLQHPLAHSTVPMHFCAATQNISTCAIENTPNDIVLETCKTCGRYCKQLNSYQNPVLDVFADDINTPTPDFLQQGSFHFKHGNFNPFLAEERR